MNASGPHSRISVQSAAERFGVALFDRLWDRYRQRVRYVRDYENVVQQAGATFVNDHIAFRTFAAQQPLVGLSSLSRLFQAIGYRSAGTYHFEDKLLNAVHFQHPHPQFPKIFVSELRTWQLDQAAREIILRGISKCHDPVTNELLAELADLNRRGDFNAAQLDAAADVFEKLPWPPPTSDDVERLNESSQYAAWVLVHGYNVNHFTALVNSHGVDSLGDIERTVAALKAAGVPMKDSIEGKSGAKLRQTATKAVMIDVDVRQAGGPSTIPWTYAYFELAERGDVTDPISGKTSRFEGFLGQQATNLFEMTRVD